MGASDRERQVGEAFVVLADTLVDDYDVVELLDRLAAQCVSLLAADAAGILLGDESGSLRVVAASDEDAGTMELLQLQTEQGPCLDCIRSQAQVRVPDVAEVVDRWPVYAAAVARSGGYRSVHAVPLRLRGEAVGAMNLFHRRPGAMTEADLALGQALADVATIGILSERTVRRAEVVAEQLQAALDSRVIIEQAKGMIAESLAVGTDVAFERLRTYCRAHGLRLGEVARQITDGRFGSAAVSSQDREHLLGDDQVLARLDDQSGHRAARR